MGRLDTLLNDTNVRLAINEYVCSHTLNRCISLLLKNDETCKAAYNYIFGKLNISAYTKGVTYEYGAIVWYLDAKYDTRDVANKNFHRVWLLKNIDLSNDCDPGNALDDTRLNDKPDFEKYGWTDVNYTIDIFDPKFKLTQVLTQKIDIAMRCHESDADKHLFGELGSKIGQKVMTRDLSNIDPSRTRGFFPYQSGKFSNNTILNGTYRIWDCGLIEFDIIFKVGYQGIDEQGREMLSCNDVAFNASPTKITTANDYQENTKYFYSLDDMKMFKCLENQPTYESLVGNMRQGNRNNYVNTYFAKLNFFDSPIAFGTKLITEFENLDYMVFASSSLTQENDIDQQILQSSKCSLTWCDKTRTSITAILITYPELEQKDFGTGAGIAANSFSCHVVGRWKTN